MSRFTQVQSWCLILRLLNVSQDIASLAATPWVLACLVVRKGFKESSAEACRIHQA